MTAQTKRKQDWENVFSNWSKPPGQTEQERCNRAVQAIKDAVAADRTLATRNVRTFPQGSYRNRTNVRQDSDVDVCVLCENTFHYDLPRGVSEFSAGIVPASYKFGNYKDDVERALVNRFGRANVRRGNKAFDVNESSRHFDADAAPCFAYRLYVNSWQYHEGTALIADDTGRLHTNFPQQQHDNGVAKNNATDRRFKKAVRIVKKLSHEMEEAGVVSARTTTSFLIESLIWNAPDHLFVLPSLQDMMQSVIAHLWDCTRADTACSTWTEANGIKLLFHGSQSWTRGQANQFLLDAWNYVKSR